MRLPYPLDSKPIVRHENLHCQSSGLISVAHGGRLGNQLGEYASLLAASKVINATPVISEVMRENLLAVFPYFTIPVLECPKTPGLKPIKWTHIGIQNIQNLTTPISKQTLSSVNGKFKKFNVKNLVTFWFLKS